MKQIVPKSKALQYYQSLQGRIDFSQDDKITFYKEFQGYEGEKKLAQLLQKYLNVDYIALYGLLLENKGTVFQIDCLLIFQQQLIMIESKNFIGEYEFKEGYLYSLTKNKYFQHPLHQLQRSDSNLKELLSRLQINLSLESFVGFVHQEFTLFTEKNPSIILPTQLIPFIKKLNNYSGRLNTKHQIYARQLKSTHIQENPFIRLPEYPFESLVKGVRCHNCRSTMIKSGRRKLTCTKCFYQESIDSGVLRSVIEFEMLFPNKKITTQSIVDWCQVEFSKKMFRSILQSYLEYHHKSNYSYFTFKSMETMNTTFIR